MSVCACFGVCMSMCACVCVSVSVCLVVCMLLAWVLVSKCVCVCLSVCGQADSFKMHQLICIPVATVNTLLQLFSIFPDEGSRTAAERDGRPHLPRTVLLENQKLLQVPAGSRTRGDNCPPQSTLLHLALRGLQTVRARQPQRSGLCPGEPPVPLHPLHAGGV